jgi:putative transport protein
MFEYLKENLLVLLFLVIAIGYLIGRLRFKGFSLGVASVLFVGIGVGSLNPGFKLPDILYILGLVLFVYTIGLSSGPGFFLSFNKEGFAVNIAVILVITLTALLTIGLSFLVDIKGNILAGLFCGSITNTPALATLIDLIKETSGNLSDSQLTTALSEPVIGYSISYPFGVIGVILGFYSYKKIFKIDVKEEAKSIEIKMGLGGEELKNIRVRVTEEKLFGWTVREIFKAKEISGIVISRIQKANSVHEDIVDGNTVLEKDDILTLVGIPQEIEKDCEIFGEKIAIIEINHKNDDLDYRRILVSDPNVIGIPLGELNLHQNFRATITRIKRGDIDFVPKEDTRLQAGDRIRVVATRNDLKAVSKYFGDSFSTISHIDYISMSIGIAFGLLIGSIPFPLPGGDHFKLGFAGGPLIVALILGKIGRSGRKIYMDNVV